MRKESGINSAIYNFNKEIHKYLTELWLSDTYKKDKAMYDIYFISIIPTYFLFTYHIFTVNLLCLKTNRITILHILKFIISDIFWS